LHQNAFGSRAQPGPVGGSLYSPPPDPLAGFGGTMQQGEDMQRKEKGRMGEEKGR